MLCLSGFGLYSRWVPLLQLESTLECTALENPPSWKFRDFLLAVVVFFSFSGDWVLIDLRFCGLLLTGDKTAENFLLSPSLAQIPSQSSSSPDSTATAFRICSDPKRLERNSTSSQQFLIFLAQTLHASCEKPGKLFTLIPTTSLNGSAHTTPNVSLFRDGLNKLIQDFVLPYSIFKLVWQTRQTPYQLSFFFGRPRWGFLISQPSSIAFCFSSCLFFWKKAITCKTRTRFTPRISRECFWLDVIWQPDIARSAYLCISN